MNINGKNIKHLLHGIRTEQSQSLGAM